MPRKWGRRKFLKASGVTGFTTIIAGCTDSGSPSETQNAPDAGASPATQEPPATSPPTETQEPEPQTSSQTEAFNYLTGLQTDYHLDPEKDGRIEREYTAYSEGNRTTTTQTFSESIYEFYSNQTRQYVDNHQYKYGSYVSDRLDKYLIDSIVSSFEEYGEEYNRSERQIIEHMMSFVQNLEYTTDEAGTGWNDYPKYPLETLVQREGDCEDTAILMANLLRNYGYETKLIYATGEMTDDDAGGHMAVGIKGEDDVSGTYYEDDEGDRYYFIETTSAGTPIGEAPSWMNEAYLQPVGVHPVPGAVTAEVTGVSNDEITVTGETVNTGPVGSDAIQIRVTLIDSDRYIIDEAISNYKSVSGFDGNINNIGSEHQATTEFTLRSDHPEEMRLVAESFVHGNEVSQTESSLRSP